MVSNGSGGFVGFNPTVIQQNMGKCQYAAKRICYGIHDEFLGILVGMERNWAAPEAVTYSNSLVEKMNPIVEEAWRVIDNVLSTIVDAYNRWCETTNYKFPMLKSPSSYSEYRPLESMVRADANGIVGIDIDYFSNSLKYVNGDNVNNQLSDFRMSIEKLSFIGQNQQRTLEESVNNICSRFQRSLIEFKTEILSEMDKIVGKYRDTAGQISREFDSMGMFVAE